MNNDENSLYILVINSLQLWTVFAFIDSILQYFNLSTAMESIKFGNGLLKFEQIIFGLIDTSS